MFKTAFAVSLLKFPLDETLIETRYFIHLQILAISHTTYKI